MRIPIEYKHCYATHRNDLIRIYGPFRMRLKPDTKLETQRPHQISTQNREKLKLKTLLDDLHKTRIVRQRGSTLPENEKMEPPF